MKQIEQGRILPTKILVKQAIQRDKIISGILIPGAVKLPCISGEVIMVGAGTPQVEMSVAIGETVMFTPHVFQKIELEGIDFLLLDVRDVLFVIPKLD